MFSSIALSRGTCSKIPSIFHILLLITSFVSLVNAAPFHAAPLNAAPLNAAPFNTAPFNAAPVNTAPVETPFVKPEEGQQLDEPRIKLVARGGEPVPDIPTCEKHFASSIPANMCMFYSGGTEKTAVQYAHDNGRYVVMDPEVDTSGWARMLPGTPAQKNGGSGPDKWTEEEMYKFFENISAAYANLCVGTVQVALIDEIPSNSIFARIELPILRERVKAGIVSEVTIVPLQKSPDPGNPINATPTGPLKQLLPETCPAKDPGEGPSSSS